MDRTQLLKAIGARLPVPGETVYLERAGTEYSWQCLDPGTPLPSPDEREIAPDAWLFFSGPWPADDAERLAAHLDDLLAEMESMCGRQDRCRWPLDQPYPHQH